MKTRIATLITLLVVSATTLTYATPIDSAANAQDSIKDQTTVLTGISNINKIEASGNVEVYVINGEKDQVKVFSSYYGQNALVQTEDGVLRITSYAKDKLIVNVTVSDLRAITADFGAVIKSDGTLSVMELNVNLSNKATARLKLDAFTANFTVNDTAQAFLSGNINEYALAQSASSKVLSAKLVAASRTETITVPAAAPAKKHKNADSIFAII